MAALGVARLGDRELLAEAGADLVVTTLDDVSVRALARAACRSGGRPEIRRRHTQQPPSVWTLFTTASTPPVRGCVKRCAR